MAYNVRIQPSALIELDEIVSYLMVFGPHTAQSFLDNWEAMLNELRDGIAEHALSRFEVLAKLGYRTAFVKNYIVLFFKEEDTLTVAHIFHQSQDYARLVLNGS